MKKWHFIFGILLMTSLFRVQAGSTNAIYWDFVSNASPSSNPFGDLTVADVTRGNGGGANFLNDSSPSSGYITTAGFSASGGTNVEASANSGVLDTSSSTYFETTFTLDLISPTLVITNVSLGSRSATTGPTILSLYASADRFVSDFESVGTNGVSADSNWSAVQFAGLSLDIHPGETLSLRVYGSNGSSTAANWRIDDLGVSVASVPEPSIIILCFAGGLMGLIFLRQNFGKKASN